RQGLERSEAFAQAQGHRKQHAPGRSPQNVARIANKRVNTDDLAEQRDGQDKENAEFVEQIKRVREYVQRISDENVTQRMRTLQVMVDQIVVVLNRLNKAMQPEAETSFNAPNTGNLVAKNRVQIPAQELRMLDVLLQRLGTELRSTHMSTVQGLQELDIDLAQFATALRMFKPKSSPADIPTEVVVDSVRLSAYTKEMMTMARQVAALAQEMYASIVSFQLDAGVESADMMHVEPFSKAPAGYMPPNG